MKSKASEPEKLTSFRKLNIISEEPKFQQYSKIDLLPRVSFQSLKAVTKNIKQLKILR